MSVIILPKKLRVEKILCFTTVSKDKKVNNQELATNYSFNLEFAITYL